MRTEQIRKLWERLRKDKKTALYCAAGLLGIVLLLFSGGGKKQTEKSAAWEKQCAETEQTLERRAEKLLASVAGVGKVRVVITLDSLERYVYVKNTETEDGGAKESVSYVLVSGDGTQSGLREKVLMPAVRGVAVSCEGGGNPQVRREVSGLLCAAFGISANRVYISAMGK